jgi:hypothetical protein
VAASKEQVTTLLVDSRRISTDDYVGQVFLHFDTETCKPYTVISLGPDLTVHVADLALKAWKHPAIYVHDRVNAAYSREMSGRTGEA